MPGIYVEAPPVTKGRGSAPGTGTRKKLVRRRRKRLTQKAASDSGGFVGQDLVDWTKEKSPPDARQVKASVVNEYSQKSKRSSTPTPSSASKDLSSSTAETSKVRPWMRHALALDTRVLGANQEIGNSILSGFQSFIDTLSHRGARPEVVVTTTYEDSLRIRTLDRLCSNFEKATVAHLKPRLDMAEKGVCIPKELSAASSWSLLSSMVDRIASSHTVRKKEVPLEVTILSTDVAMFSDTSKKAHVEAFQRFRDHIRTKASESLRGVCHIRLVVSKTNVLVFSSAAGEATAEGTAVEESGIGGDQEVPPSRQTHAEASAECIQALEAAIDEVENDNMMSSDDSLSSIEFTLSVLDGTALGYQALSRTLLRSSLFGLEASHRLTFDLPETPDGTQCCVSFDVSFQTFPYAVDSTEASLLRNELRSLTLKPLELVQMVPLSSVDAGLLYGVPLMLRSGVTGNFDQFQEMEILSRVLFRHLQERDLAILLRSTASCPNGQRHEQLFLLMAQEFPQTTKQPPQTGLLFRYAQADQLLAEATPARPCPALQDELGLQYSEYVEESLNTLDCDSFNPLLRASQASAILSENSVALHSPPQTATNGAEEEVQVSSTSDQQAANLSHGEDIENDETDMITAETHAEPDVVMADDSFVNPDDVWNDSAGVGSRKRSMATQDSIENDTDDDDFPGFVYD